MTHGLANRSLTTLKRIGSVHVVTPDELRELIADWPSTDAFRRDIGVSRATVYHWLNGVRSIPEPTARLAALLYAHPNLRNDIQYITKQTAADNG
jgi:DNA-binding transcriptional regulator YiaG